MSDIMSVLQASTVLARVATTALGASRTDRGASEKVAKDANATTGSARVLVSRIAGSEQYHRNIVAIQQRARVVLHDLTTPFRDDGWRILPNLRFMDFIQRYGAVKKEFDAARQRMIDDADIIMMKAQTSVGNLHVDKLTREEIEHAYTLSFDVQDYPAGQFTGLPGPVVSSLQRAMDRSAEVAWTAAKRDVLERLLGPVTSFIMRMEAFEERSKTLADGTPTKAGIFRDSAITNIAEIVQLAKALNIDGDAQLTEIIDHLEEFIGVDPDDVRNNADVRNILTTTARTAADNLKEWIK